MGPLRMIAADTDEAYLESLTNFLTNTCSNRFQISSFTDKSCLDRYFSENNEKIDIILVNKELFTESWSINKAVTVIFLTEGNINSNSDGYHRVNKYQHCERLVSNIIKIYSENANRGIIYSRTDKKAKVIGFFSPAGGTGKTTVSVCTSIQCANKGLSVFYLNLENFQSTSLYFDCNFGSNFSNLLYYIKNKDKNLRLRIEGLSSIDTDFNVRYFSPPESAIEMGELTPEELSRLINELHDAGPYDAILIDMSSRLDSCYLNVLEGCDVIILVITQDEACMLKLKRFSDELSVLLGDGKLRIWDKTVVVVNRYEDNGLDLLKDFRVDGTDPLLVKLPESSRFKYLKGAEQFTDMNNPFNAGISRMVREFILRGARHGT